MKDFWIKHYSFTHLQVTFIPSHLTLSLPQAGGYHWQSDAGGGGGGGGRRGKGTVDDMVLLPKISEAAIADNLKKRFLEDK